MPRHGNSERDVEEMKQTILQFLNENPGPHYPLDLAENLNMEPELVFEAIEKLLIDNYSQKPKAPEFVKKLPPQLVRSLRPACENRSEIILVRSGPPFDIDIGVKEDRCGENGRRFSGSRRE